MSVGLRPEKYPQLFKKAGARILVSSLVSRIFYLRGGGKPKNIFKGGKDSYLRLENMYGLWPKYRWDFEFKVTCTFYDLI